MLKCQLNSSYCKYQKNNADILVSVPFQIHVLQYVDTFYRLEDIFAFLFLSKKVGS